MQARLGDNFLDVRVHTDARAGRLAHALGARAFTIGTDVYFAPGEFRPSETDGKRLLAHELTHVVQQRNALIDISGLEPQGSAAEREADTAASVVTAGWTAKRPSAAPRGIPRDVGWASRGEIPDPYGMGYNTIYKNAGPESKGAVLALASLETPSMFVNLDAYKKLEAPVRKSILALEPHATGTACAGWFDLLLANDPDFKPTLTPEQINAGNLAYYESTRDAIRQKKAESTKAELPTLGRVAIEARWKDNKDALITNAQTPNHGIKAETLHAIWTNYWSDKYHIARETADTCERRLWTVQADANNPTLEATFRQAKSVEELANLMFANAVDALEICRAADAAGKSLTLDELNQRVIDHSKFMGGMQLLATALSMPKMGGGAPGVKTAPPKTAPPKTAPPKTAPPKTAPPKTAPPKTAPPKTEPPKTEPPKTAPPKTAPPKTAPPKTEPPKTAPPKTAPPKTAPPKTAPPKTEPPKTEPPKTAPPKTAPPKTAPPKTEPPKTEPPKTEPPKTEPPKTEPPKTEPVKTDGKAAPKFPENEFPASDPTWKQWPPPKPAVDKPDWDKPGGARYRYDRYRHQKWEESGKQATPPKDLLTPKQYYDRYVAPKAVGQSPGEMGSPAHKELVVGVRDANGVGTQTMGAQRPDAVGRIDQPIKIPGGPTVAPQKGGRVLYEAENFFKDGSQMVSKGREQVRQFRKDNPNATIVVQDTANPKNVVVYEPGTQPPPPGALKPGTPNKVPVK